MAEQRYNINYKTFETFMYDVADDLSAYDDQGYLNSDKYIKLVQKVNADLSVRINPTKETAIDVQNYKAKLPDDFKLLNDAYICYDYKITKDTVGIQIEYENVPVTNMNGCSNSIGCTCSNCVDTLNTCAPSINSCLNAVCQDKDNYQCTPYQVWRKSKKELVNIYGVLRLSLSTRNYAAEGCYQKNPWDKAVDEMSITKEGDCYFMNTSFKEGVVYINYVSHMVDDDNNILLLDHPLTNEYYEYEVKARIYEDLWLNGIEEVATKLKYVKEELRKAKIIAKNFVNTFDFAELKQVHFANRQRMARKYFDRIM